MGVLVQWLYKKEEEIRESSRKKETRDIVKVIAIWLAELALDVFLGIGIGQVVLDIRKLISGK